MSVPLRLIGAAALAVAALCVAPLILPYPVAVPTARAQDDPVLFYRDPMGAPEVSKTPRKDSMGMDYLPVRRSAVAPLLGQLPSRSPAAGETPLFWRDPMGGDDIALAPRKDSMGMDYLPVRAADIAKRLPPLPGAAPADSPPKSAGDAPKRRILYYRNPMGLADTSPVPKKDSMGMDYLPVYEGEDDEAGIVKIAPGKIQRTGVRSEPARVQAIDSRVQVPGTLQIDERSVVIVATRAAAFIEKVANVTTGDKVHKGQILMSLFSPEIAAAAAQYAANPGFEGARTRLMNLGVAQDVLAEIERTRKPPLSVSWRAPGDGIILERNAIEGMKAEAGQTLFRIADLTNIWALVDVSERDYGRLRVGQSVALRVRALPGRIFAGQIGVIYPQINRDTRAVRVRIELANADLALRPDMYVEAEIAVGEAAKVVTIPDDALIDSGARQIVVFDRGEGRFEPREVKAGRRGEGRVEILEGVAEGDRVVTSANFLIDAESNLKAALKSFARPEAGE